MTGALFQVTLLANVLWFGAGFWYFAIKHETAAKLLIPKSARRSPLFSTMSAALPFLGGMNLALSLLAAMLLARQDLFIAPAEQAILAIAFGVAHATQFLINVPVARRGGRLGEAYWEVLGGPMLFIFVVDAGMTLLNWGVAALLLTGAR
jgi:hypothetical protein